LKPAPRPVPFACVRDRPGTSACGRGIESGEWAFEDADRALAIYADGRHLRACPDCVARHRAKRAREAADGECGGAARGVSSAR
jgi:hypothetical protein